MARNTQRHPIKPSPPPTIWETYKGRIRLPVVLLLHDATIVVIVLALNMVVFLFSKSVEAWGMPTWFTRNVEIVDLTSALINVTIFAFDTTGKIFAASNKGSKNEPTV